MTSNFPLSLREAGDQLRSGEITSVELTSQVLARADVLDEQLGSYLARFDEPALAAAAVADTELQAGRDRGPLHGIPIGIKDIIAAREGPTTGQSLITNGGIWAGVDAPVTSRLRQAGAVITGKLTTMEFAIGMPDATKPFPTPRNPWDLDCWAGGSSSGSGSGVAAGLFFAALGTDTGGSIRIPAAYCGVTGLMPTYGRVPKSGCIPLGYSLDHIGPIARTAADCAAVLEVLGGVDATDPFSVDRPVPHYTAGLDDDLTGVRIGYVREDHHPDFADPALSGRFADACASLERRGAVLTEVTIPHYQQGITASVVTMGAESFAYHARDLAERWADYGASTRRWLALGALVSGGDYVQAQRVRRHAQRAINELFDRVELIVTPTAALGAPSLSDIAATRTDPASSAGVIFTQYWDMIDSPVLALPIGPGSSGLPLSMQIVGRPFDEQLVLRAGHAYQCAESWHRAVPTAVGRLQQALPPALQMSSDDWGQGAP